MKHHPGWLVGLACAAGDPDKPEAEVAGLEARLQEIQADLFILGADLATPPGNEASYLPRVEESQVTKLEEWIDAYDDQLPALQNFILPGGTPLAAALHFARTICRRAEREVVTLASHETLGDPPLLYLNRLSDLLFVLGRFANHRAGCAEVEWAPRKKE